MKTTSKVDLIVEKLDAEQRKLKSVLSSLSVHSGEIYKPWNTPLLVLRELSRSADNIRKLHN